MKALLLLTTVLGLCATCSADTYPRQPGIDVIHYAFSIALSDVTDQISATAVIELKFVKDGLTEFSLDLATAAGGRGMTVSEVRAGEAPAPFVHQADRLRITLSAPPAAGDRVKFTVRYRGVPGAGLRIGANRHGERTFFSNNWPDNARQWLPMIDHPYDKATSEFIVFAPGRYQVVANGLLQEETDLADGQRLTHWKQSVPIASWLNALGVARFTSHHADNVKGVPVQTWVYPQDRQAGLKAFEAPARRVLDFFGDRIGPFPYEKLAGVQAPGIDGGMENASVIFYGERSVDETSTTSLVAHEVAHQWFGDSVTEHDWNDVWLSEGFATYFAMLFIEHEAGRAAFVAELKKSRELVFATEAANPGATVVHDNLSDMRRVLNPLVYQKGGWTLHMLRGLVGSEAFFAGIRQYYAQYRDGNASTDDFRRVMEKASGKDLAWFFRQWLSRAGSPSLEGGWRYNAATKSVTIDLAQFQPGDPYRLPLEVGLYFEGSPLPRIVKIEMTEPRQSYDLPVDTQPTSVVLDPDTGMLLKSRFGKR